MTRRDDLYAFVFKGALAKESVDRELERASPRPTETSERIAQKLPLELLDKDAVASAEKMAVVYSAIAAFENSVRKFINDRFLEEVGANWWTSHVAQGVRDSAERRKREEEQIRWHGGRGSSMIYYTQLGDLVSIIQNNFQLFQDHIESVEWARQIFSSLERSRNVIMHSGELAMNDIERVAMNIRDWLRQVGG